MCLGDAHELSETVPDTSPVAVTDHGEILSIKL